MHWEVTLMTDNKKVPRLRFKEFTDAWEQRKLGDIAKRVIRKNKENDILPVLTNSADLGIVLQNDYFDKAIAKNLNNYYIVSHNDFVYNPRISKKAPFGPINRNKLNIQGVMSPLYLVFRFNSEMDLNFLEYYFQSSKWYPFMYKNGDSGARADRFAIKNSVLMNMTINVPTLDQQKRIGKILLLLENNIALHQRKLNLLNQLKKGMLQKLFAGKNQKQPNLRFKGLADTWKKETLKEVSQWSKGQGLPKKDLNTYEKGKEVIHYADLYKLGPVIKGVIHWSTSKEGRKIPTNSIIFPMSDVTPTGLARTSAVVKDGILAGGDVLIDNLSSKIQSKFLSYEINANSHQILSLVTGTTVKHINSKSLNRLSITYPNMQEQEMISNTLENIFTQIEFYRYRISKLQQLKKSLLQNMFI